MAYQPALGFDQRVEIQPDLFDPRDALADILVRAVRGGPGLGLSENIPHMIYRQRCLSPEQCDLNSAHECVTELPAFGVQ